MRFNFEEPASMESTAVSLNVPNTQAPVNTPPTTTYERIMSTLAEQNATPSPPTALNDQLTNSKEPCQNEKNRADKAEQTIKNPNTQHNTALACEKHTAEVA
jgi:hypothetical protein